MNSDINKIINPLAFFSLLAFFLILLGCGITEGVIQKSEKSYLWFTGNTNGAVVYIDDLDMINLQGSYHIDNDGNKRKRTKPVHYKISPGKHTVRVERNGKIVVNRVLILGNNIVKEIMVP